jgi:hypothetical protein
MAAKMVYTNRTIIMQVLRVGTVINQTHQIVGVGLVAINEEAKLVYQINPGRWVDRWFAPPKWEFDQNGKSSFGELTYDWHTDTWDLQERSWNYTGRVRWLYRHEVRALQSAHEGRELLAQVTSAFWNSML